MKISDITVAAMLALCTSTAFAQTYTKAQQQAWMEKAGLCKPVLDTTVCHPVAVVDIVKDDKAFQGYKAWNRRLVHKVVQADEERDARLRPAHGGQRVVQD